MTDLRTRSSATELRESMVAVTRQIQVRQRERRNEQLAVRLHVRVQSLTDSINELVSRGLVSRRPDEDDRRRQLIEVTATGIALLDDDRAERDAWLNGTMRDNLSDLEFNLLMLVAPVLRKLAYAEGKVGTLD